MQRLFGLETEYGFAVLDSGERNDKPRKCAREMLRRARGSLKCLPGDSTSGVFLQNGSRLYLDTGCHPEVATPECSTSREAVRYVLAGDRILTRLAREMESAVRGRRVVLLKTNVDYFTGSTWGCHESYLHRADPDALRTHLVPHLVSRVCYCGAGGLEPFAPGINFVLSPRAFMFSRVVSGDSTHSRGIYHTKQEALNKAGYRRLHVLVGESLCSQRAAWLKVGVTALLVAMTEAGIKVGGGLQLRSPVDALRAFAADPTCEATAGVRPFRRMNAVQIQRRYLHEATACVGEDFMPAWAEEICDAWREVLDALEAGPDAVRAILDWAIKKRLFERHIARRGVALEDVRRWSLMARSSPPEQAGDGSERVRQFMRPGAPANRQAAREAGLGAEEAATLLGLKEEICEIDMRYSQLGAGSIFHALERAPGAVDHRLPGLGDVEEAMRTPPSVGRARLRGQWIGRLAGTHSRYNCDWSHIRNLRSNHRLDLTDPFARSVRWLDADGRTIRRPESSSLRERATRHPHCGCRMNREESHACSS